MAPDVYVLQIHRESTTKPFSTHFFWSTSLEFLIKKFKTTAPPQGSQCNLHSKRREKSSPLFTLPEGNKSMEKLRKRSSMSCMTSRFPLNYCQCVGEVHPSPLRFWRFPPPQVWEFSLHILVRIGNWMCALQVHTVFDFLFCCSYRFFSFFSSFLDDFMFAFGLVL